MATCPVFTGEGGASETVQNIFAVHQSYAAQYFNLLSQSINAYLAALNDLQNLSINTTIQWNDPGLGGPWNSPTPPAAFGETFNVPEGVSFENLPEPNLPYMYSYPSAPTEPAFDTSGLPSPWTGEIPTDIPDVDDVTLPDLNVDDFPAAPTLQNIPIPEMEPVAYPEFTGVMPSTDVDFPEFATPTEETVYTSAELTALQNQILSVLSGNRGYLDTIWDLIWTREFRNETMAANQATEAVLELWASRNWSAPGGVEAAQLLEIEQKLQDSWSARAREVAIEQNKQEVERFNFHVAQGIALEGVLINYASQRAERALKAVEIINNAMVAMVQAKVAIINIQLEGYKTQAAVHRDLIQAEMLKVQVFEAEIKAASLLGELDERKVRIYLAQLEGIQKQVAIYLGQMEGVKVELEVSRLKITAAVEKINAVKAQLEAKKLEYDGYDSKIRGQLGIANIWQTEGQIFLARTQAITAQNSDQVRLYEAQLKQAEFVLERIKTDLARFETEYKGEAERFDSLTKKYAAEVSLYDSKVKGEIGRMGGEAEKYKALTDRAKSEEALKLQQAEINLRTLLRLSELETAGLEKIMMVHAQIGSASLAALNANATIQGIDSTSEQFEYQCT